MTVVQDFFRVEAEGPELIMALNLSRLNVEPLMDPADKLAAEKTSSREVGSTDKFSTRPFGLRFAVSPVRDGKHEKTYYTVTETENTQVSRDGVVETIADQVQRERED